MDDITHNQRRILRELGYPKLVYFNYDEIKDLSKYPYLLDNLSNDELTLSPQERAKKRISKIRSRIRNVKNRNGDNLKFLGKLFLVKDVLTLIDLEKQLTFQSRSGRTISFLHLIEDQTSDEIPHDISQIFNQYREVMEENFELTKRIHELETEINENETSPSNQSESNSIINQDELEILLDSLLIFNDLFKTLTSSVREYLNKSSKKIEIPFEDFKNKFIPEKDKRETIIESIKIVKSLKEKNKDEEGEII